MNTETAATPAPRQTSIAKLVRKRDALGRRYKVASQRTSQGLAWKRGPMFQALLQELYEDAVGREIEADEKLATVCREILLAPPTSDHDLALKGRTVAFIVEHGDIWPWDDFKDAIIAFADQVASWSGEGRHV